MLEEIAAVWASVGVGVVGARAVLLRAGHLRHRGAEAARGCRTCSAASCSAPTASPRRTPAPTPRRCGPRARRDGDDYVINGAKAWTTHGGAGRLLQGDGAHVGRPQRHLLLPGARRRPGSDRRPARAQDGPHRLGDRDDALRRRTRLRGPAARRGGRRPQDRARRPRLRPARHRRRSRPGSPRARSTTRSRTPTSGRPSASGSSTTRASAFLLADMEAAVAVRPRDDAARRAPQGPRPAVLPARPRSPSWSPPTTP